METDPALQEFITTWKPIAYEDSHAFRRVAPYAARDPRILLEADSFLTRIMHEVETASKAPGPTSDILPFTKIHYLVERIFPPEYVPSALALEQSTSIMLFIAPPGYIHMAFIGASPEDRKGYDKIIKNAQQHFRVWRNKGGRPSLKDIPAASSNSSKETDPRFVARLRLVQERSNADAASILEALHPGIGWLWPYEAGTEERISDRISRYTDVGDNLLREEIGPEWVLRERAAPGRDSVP